MARGQPDSATSGWFVCINDQPSLDFGGARNPDGQGDSPPSGRVVQGMDVVRKIQQAPQYRCSAADAADQDPESQPSPLIWVADLRIAGWAFLCVPETRRVRYQHPDRPVLPGGEEQLSVAGTVDVEIDAGPRLPPIVPLDELPHRHAQPVAARVSHIYSWISSIGADGPAEPRRPPSSSRQESAAKTRPFWMSARRRTCPGARQSARDTRKPPVTARPYVVVVDRDRITSSRPFRCPLNHVGWKCKTVR